MTPDCLQRMLYLQKAVQQQQVESGKCHQADYLLFPLIQLLLQGLHNYRYNQNNLYLL